MSRTGWSATSFLRLDAAVLTAAPITMAIWFRSVAMGATNKNLIGLYNSAATGALNEFGLQITTANAVQLGAADASAATSMATSTTWANNTWNAAMAVIASATDRRVFLNGGGKATSAVSRIPAGINRLSIGVRDGVTIAGTLDPADFLAEAALWNVALTDADSAAHAVGVPAYLIRPDKLVAYIPLR